jgi:hypothetical protein
MTEDRDWFDATNGAGALAGEMIKALADLATVCTLPPGVVEHLLRIVETPPERWEESKFGLSIALGFAAGFNRYHKPEEARCRDEAEHELATFAKLIEPALHQWESFGSTARYWAERAAADLDWSDDGAVVAGHNLRGASVDSRGNGERPRHATIAAALRVAASVARRHRPQPRRAGRPSKGLDSGHILPAVEVLAVQVFAYETTFGWTVTISPENRSGTLLEFLETVRPHVPPGVVPPEIDLRRLQQLRQMLRKRHDK